jgi:3-phenylpropionate/cinnamic acid dioxygenase small subunit
VSLPNGVSDAQATALSADVGVFFTAQAFLFEEAERLDRRRFQAWLELLADDIVYQAPVRVTRERGPLAEVSDEMFHLDENLTTLRWRVERLGTDFAWAEDPPSRTRHCVSNIRVRSASADQIEVSSYLLLYRNRGSDASHDLLSGERQDVLRRTGRGFDGWQLARRQVILDQATLGTKNLAIFL